MHLSTRAQGSLLLLSLTLTSTGRRTSNVNPTVSTPAPVLTDVVKKCVDTAAEAIATHKEAKLVFMQGLVKEDLEGGIQRTYNSPFSWDITSSEYLCWSTST